MEGNSIRSTERLTGVHRDTIMRLGVRVGNGCQKLHDEIMVKLQSNLIEIDEIWSYVGKKQGKGGTREQGDQFTYIATDIPHMASKIAQYPPNFPASWPLESRNWPQRL